jgi:replication-associated recombination protein RarA
VEPDLFTAAAEERQEKDPSSSPLAVRMRPRTLDEVVGQQHLLKPGSPLRRLVGEGGSGPAGPSSVILWGPPGTGKTTLAYVVSKATNKRFVELSAITAGVKEVRTVIDGARRATGGYGKETVLFLDEIHRFSKAQQDSLLPAVENRWVTLIAATTENPYFSVISPLLSRSLLLTLEPLTDDDLRGLIKRALADERGLKDAVTLPEDTEEHLLRIAVAAAQAVAMIGFPEAALTLSHATIALALAPKSNAATTAIGAAMEDVRKGLAGPVPPHLRDGHYKGAAKLGHAQGYVYPHDLPEGIAAQQYAPDAIKEREYYTPTRHGAEARYADAVEWTRKHLGRKQS